MRKLGLSLFLGVSLSLAACGGGSDIYSPSNPRVFDRGMFNEDAISGYSASERAYVMGHGIGVYLMGKTLPEKIGYTGYKYRPGASSPHAVTQYEWEDVLVARSGGVDGTGGYVYHDDVSIDTEGDPNDPNDSDPGENPPTDVGDPFDDVDGEPDDPDGPGNDEPDDPNDGDGDCSLVAERCADFLGPATVEAINLAAQVDAYKFVDPGMTGQAAEDFVTQFRRGIADALELPEQAGEISETLHVKDALMIEGVCWL
jgi:hypothetical protein